MPHRRKIAESILEVFRKQRARSGYVCPAGLIFALARKRDWSVEQTEDGVSYGIESGWFNGGFGGYLRLTDVGFDEIARQPNAAVASFKTCVTR